MQQTLAQRLRLPHQYLLRHPWPVEGINREVDVGILVIDDRSDDTLRQVVRFVAELLARLIKLLLDVARRRVVLQEQRHQHEARPGIGLDVVVPMQLLQPLFQRIGNQVLHLLRSGTRPGRAHGKDLEGEGRVFGTPQVQEREEAGERKRREQEKRN